MAITPNSSRIDDADPDSPGTDMVDGLKKRMGRFFLLFGSAAAVATFLLFAGFLSDFAVYRLAGLPRLSFNYTSLVESGAEVVVDTLSLLVGSWQRGFALLLVFVLLVTIWAYQSTPRLKRLACSDGTYHLARLGFFLYAAFLLAGQIGLIQQGLHPERVKQQKVAEALAAAYKEADGGIPDPRARLRAIERIDYQITAFPFPNWAERWLEGTSRSKTVEWQETAGLPLRLLPESRRAAAHVFGWLVLSLLILLLAVVLLPGWQNWLQAKKGCGAARRPFALPIWLCNWLPAWSQPALDDPLRYLISPLTLLLCMLSFALLPLSHGLLARSSLGNEEVMVMLEAKAQDQTTDRDAAKRSNRQCLDEDVRKAMETAEDSYRKALRDLLQTRPTEAEYGDQAKALRGALRTLIDTAIAVECPLTVQTLWELRPSVSLSQAYPDIATDFRAAMARALRHYEVRLGTLLSYPRDDQPLSLIETLQPRMAGNGGQWSLTAHERTNIREVVVLPNTLTRKVADFKRSVIQDPDSDAKKSLLQSQDSAALAATLELLENRFFYVSHAGVAVTALGGMAQANVNERPDLSARSIDLLADIASSGKSNIWPDKENNIRSAAATALHLTRSPYAAWLLAKELRKDQGKPCDEKRVGIHCLPQTITTAGFLLSDLTAESRLLPVETPKALIATRDTLTGYLLKRAMDEKAGEDHRGAACSSINNSGVRNITDAKLSADFFTALKKMDPARNLISLPVCVNTMSLLRMGGKDHRAFLRKLFFSKAPEVVGAVESYKQARRIALITLSELGLAGESDFMFRAYTESDAEIRDGLIAKFMDEADTPILASKLLDCVDKAWGQDEERTRLCLTGLQKLKESYDGDEGGTQRIEALLRNRPVPALKVAACEVLRNFEQRNGMLARQLFKEGILECPQAQEQDANEEKLRRLLEALGKAAADGNP